ncbi:MAG: chromosome segregation protein SMC [Saprospiraceae bacterium]|nr:chromosome segregation protein SMC [Saprospiraceae bacterium]
MRLKNLEIKGFKSFANETVIHFDQDVIGIVGPNGAGKSNIVDAIRWVLGEQKSKELRLDTMTSVIFNGTKKRKQSGMASVSLTFENTKNLLPTDYHTVTISRVLYRSGDSEYRLNNVPCRLKDITSLFLDTGIGSNSYAIIALGMVDDILADKDNARRRMFEQAAGVSKYKIRKRETLNKLKSTTEDLERVEDLLFEIENNLNSLEKQAKRTKRYFELKQDYKVMSLDLAVIKTASLRIQQAEIQKQLTQEEDAYRSIEAEIRQKEAALEQEKKANLDKEKALSERQRDLNEAVAKIRNMESDRRVLEQRIQFLRQTNAKLDEQIQDASRKIDQLRADVERYQTDLSSEKRIEAELEEQLDEAEANLKKVQQEHGELKTDLDSIMQRQQQAERAVFEMEKQRAINQNRSENLHNEHRRLSEEQENRQKELDELLGGLKDLEVQEKEFQTALQTLEMAENKRQDAIVEAEAHLEQITVQIREVNRNLDAKRNEFKLTKSMVENLEGFPESIKFLSQHKSWKKDTPLLSDLIYVQETYRIAIENYLEPYLNYYVVANLAEAAQAVQLLSESQKGKANFFLLDVFKDYRPPMAMAPNTTSAIDLIETDPQYHSLVSYLLENVVVTESEQIQKSMEDERLVVLSRSGRFIQKRFTLSGGSIGLFEGKKIGRKKNLEILETAITKLEREEDKLSTKYFQQKTKLEGLKTQHSKEAMQEATSKLNRLSQDRVSVQTRLENHDQFIQQSQNKLQVMQETLEQIELEENRIKSELINREAAIGQVKNEIANTDGSYRQVAEQLSQASTHFNNQNIEFIRQQNKVNAIQRELHFREKQLEETLNALSQNKSNQGETAQELTELHEKLAEMETSLKASYAEKEAKESTLTEVEQTYFQARGGINELEESLRGLNRKQQAAQSLINQLKEKLTEYRFQLSAVSERLHAEFSVRLDDIKDRQVETGLPQDQLQEKVDRLKSRLDNYGEINPMAVEAYDEMKERYDTITQQRDDINKAKDDLMETIKEIEETATAQFLEAFNQARLYFIDVFRSLFTDDDTCDLILLDPENPLESNIEIVARPKGKRPQTISQLSGGEKTLTATALLFALYLLKPAPFCIFDEVDAPLDDANIEKFNRIIKKFSKDSQFIIVTHNKLTMAAVDTIYGVYMQEQGVSNVSQVDFRDFEHRGIFEAAN